MFEEGDGEVEEGEEAEGGGEEEIGGLGFEVVDEGGKVHVFFVFCVKRRCKEA